MFINPDDKLSSGRGVYGKTPRPSILGSYYLIGVLVGAATPSVEFFTKERFDGLVGELM